MASTVTALTSGGGIALSGDTSGSLQLQTNNGTTAMTIDTSQNVGIGTTSPSVAGVTIAKASDTYLRLKSGAYAGVDVLQGSDGVAYIWNRDNLPMSFGTNNTERMRIDSSGNLLIGTTSNIGGSATKLNIVGTGSPTEICAIKETTGGSGFRYFISFQNSAGTYIGNISTTGTTTSYVTTSDYRLKENIAPMTGALAKVAQLKPVTYTWKADGSDGQGFIAHELQEVVPDAVVGQKDATRIVDELDAEGKVIGQKEEPVYQGIDTSFLVATLTAAIQEQQAIITDLKARIETLEGAK